MSKAITLPDFLKSLPSSSAASGKSVLLTDTAGAASVIPLARFLITRTFTTFNLDNPPGTGIFGMFDATSKSSIPFVVNGAAIIVVEVGIITHEFVMGAYGELFYRKANNSNWENWLNLT